MGREGVNLASTQTEMVRSLDQGKNSRPKWTHRENAIGRNGRKLERTRQRIRPHVWPELHGAYLDQFGSSISDPYLQHSYNSIHLFIWPQSVIYKCLERNNQEASYHK